MCGAAFFPAGGARVKIRGEGRGEKARKSTDSQNFTKVRKGGRKKNGLFTVRLTTALNEKYNITHFNINFDINNYNIILAENQYCIRNRATLTI